jgi:hypothetical protein
VMEQAPVAEVSRSGRAPVNRRAGLHNEHERAVARVETVHQGNLRLFPMMRREAEQGAERRRRGNTSSSARSKPYQRPPHLDPNNAPSQQYSQHSQHTHVRPVAGKFNPCTMPPSSAGSNGGPPFAAPCYGPLPDLAWSFSLRLGNLQGERHSSVSCCIAATGDLPPAQP